MEMVLKSSLTRSTRTGAGAQAASCTSCSGGYWRERKTKGSPQFAATNLCGVIALPVVTSVPSGELETQHRVPTGLWFAESSHGTACETFQAGKAVRGECGSWGPCLHLRNAAQTSAGGKNRGPAPFNR